MKTNMLKTFMESDRGEFVSTSTEYSLNLRDWTLNHIRITPDGQLINVDISLYLINNLQSCSTQILPEHDSHTDSTAPIVFIKTFENEKIYFKSKSTTEFLKLLASLMIWQNLKPQGLDKKWYFTKKLIPKKDVVNELLVCRFKVYGPLPKLRNLNIVDGPKVPIYHSNNVQEGWFYTMGVLKSSGILNLLSELDGTLLYSIDITELYSSEIRQVHHSIFESSNVLFIGIINELRTLNIIKNIEPKKSHKGLIFQNSKPLISSNRILVEFPLHIDLEDWFVGLNYFAKREYIGSVLQNQKENFRVSKKVFIDIIEANFDDNLPDKNSKLYAEVLLWNSPWARTSIVQQDKNPFWKEEFVIDLPISTQYFHILIKKCESVEEKEYTARDLVIGTVYITPDMFSKTQEERLTIFDTKNVQIGKLLIKINLSEYHILPPRNFKVLENMMANAPFQKLISFIQTNIPNSELEESSLMLLDIFQSLHVEDKWFKTLMEEELIKVDNLTKKNRLSKSTFNASSTNNVFNTLFRGNSILTKSLERYNLRIGQEYLEKVVGEFVLKVSTEKKDCELDWRAVKTFSDEEQEKVLQEHFDTLYNYAELIWNKIYITSNDLPQPIKDQLKNFRTKVELACDPDDKTTALNCLTAFIFLRFFCPAILNPKLFYLTKDHQTGEVQRTLTLIAKILLTLANRSRFAPHKEPYLVQMNEFIERHESEVLDYFDKITGRKNDFNEKILDLSHEVKRFDLDLSVDESLELPTNPYLIDKYLRLVELIHVLDYNKYRKDEEDEEEDENNVYKIGSLEFEKSEFLDLAGDNETEGFLKSLLKSNENIFSFINSSITLRDLQIQSTTLMGRISQIETFLYQSEVPANFSLERWALFIDNIMNSAMLDPKKNLVYSDEPIAGHKFLTDGALSSLKMKFASNGRLSINVSSDVDDKLPSSPSTNSIQSLKSNKNPFKKWLRKK